MEKRKIELTEEEFIKKFNKKQMKEILLGLDRGLDVSIYAKPEFDADQMKQIRLGLEKGLNVSIYARPEFNVLADGWRFIGDLKRT